MGRANAYTERELNWVVLAGLLLLSFVHYLTRSDWIGDRTRLLHPYLNPDRRRRERGERRTNRPADKLGLDKPIVVGSNVNETNLPLPNI